MDTTQACLSRTSGDGMDNSIIHTLETLPRNLITQTRYDMLKCLTPVVARGKVIKTIPKYHPKEQKKQKYLTMKGKEPKFVPYEPFKAAVTPIIAKKRKSPVVEARTKNNVDIHDLVSQMNDIRVNEMKETKRLDLSAVVAIDEYNCLKKKYDTDIKNLRETNSHLENQLKFQAQVNSELKTLLVAAVGEDLESRVQHLTEDKLQLARALLNSANHLTSHQEQTEWLSGQCEVWRSKFLASSLMVEELARWKSALTIRINEMHDNIKSLLDERNKLRTLSASTFNSLNCGKENVALPDRYNIITLAQMNAKLSDSFNKTMTQDLERDFAVVKPSDILKTPAETIAYRIMQNPVTLTTKPDAVCSAVMGAAAMTVSSASGQQLFFPHSSVLPFKSNCCAHCKGETIDI